MAKDVKLLVLAREGDRRGEVIDQRPVSHNWGRRERPPTFVPVRLNDIADDLDLREMYESGQHLGEPDPETGVPTVVKDYSKRWILSEEKIAEGLAAPGQTVVELTDFEDRSL